MVLMALLFSEPEAPVLLLPLLPLLLPALPDADDDDDVPEDVLLANAAAKGGGFVELSFVSMYEFDSGMSRHSMMGVMLYLGV